MNEVNPQVEARDAILSSIREHLAASSRFDAQAAHPPKIEERTISSSKEPETDRRSIDVFREAVEAVSGHCLVVSTLDEVAHAVQRIINEKKARRVAVSDASLIKAVLNQLNTDATFLPVPKKSELFDCDIGITTAQWAIAETGTLVLESERELNRLASLVPPIHIAIIEAAGIRRTMSEVLDLVKSSDVGLSRAVTFITGPSRTSDIELTLAIGVHGPGELYVIVIDEPTQPA